jgi:hypothetical protein
MGVAIVVMIAIVIVPVIDRIKVQPIETRPIETLWLKILSIDRLRIWGSLANLLSWE